MTNPNTPLTAEKIAVKMSAEFLTQAAKNYRAAMETLGELGGDQETVRVLAEGYSQAAKICEYALSSAEQVAALQQRVGELEADNKRQFNFIGAAIHAAGGKLKIPRSAMVSLPSLFTIAEEQTHAGYEYTIYDHATPAKENYE